MPSPMLQRLTDERQAAVDFVESILNDANVDGQTRDLSTSELESLERTRGRVTELDAQIKGLSEFEETRDAGNAAAANYLRPTGPGTAPERSGLGARVDTRAWQYASPGHVIVDQLRAAPVNIGGQSDPDARERLLSAGVIFAGISDDDSTRAHQRAQELASETRATQVTGDTPGVLPTPIIGEIMNDIDASRPFVTTVGAKPLDFAGSTFERPVITQHTAVGQQTTEATSTGVGTQKLIISGVPFSKTTWGGFLDVSRQDIDWTSPGAWNAIVTDLQDQYGLQTENAAADAFATAVTAQVEVAGAGSASTLRDWLDALYAAAALAYAGAGRLPDAIWMDLGTWGALGPLIDSQVATNKASGTSSATSFSGMLVDVPRIVVPSFPANTLIIGASRWTEFYEDRIGLLTAVQPSVFGVQVAYGGYAAFGTLKAGAFAKVVNLV